MRRVEFIPPVRHVEFSTDFLEKHGSILEAVQEHLSDSELMAMLEDLIHEKQWDLIESAPRDTNGVVRIDQLSLNSLDELAIFVNIVMLDAVAFPSLLDLFVVAVREKIKKLVATTTRDLRELKESAQYYQERTADLREAAQTFEAKVLADAHAEACLSDDLLLNPHGFFVYCLWGDDTSTPLYVGESTNILSRLGTHMSDWKKSSKVRRITITRCKTEVEMHRTEARLIAHYQPPMNVQGVVR